MTDSSQTPYVPRTGKRLRFAAVIFVLAFIGALLYWWLRPHGVLRQAVDATEVADSARLILASSAIYAQDNSNHFPPDLAVLLPRGLKPASLMFPPEGPPPSAKTTAAEIAARSVFVYAGAGVHAGDPPAIIVLYTRAGVIPGKRTVAFADGHVEEIPDADLAAAFAQNNTAREKFGRPRITLDAPAPQAATR